MSDFSMIVVLLFQIDNACSSMVEKPMNVIFPISWVSSVTGLSRYKAKKLIKVMMNEGLIVRVGNRYKYAENNNMSKVLLSLKDKNEGLFINA